MHKKTTRNFRFASIATLMVLTVSLLAQDEFVINKSRNRSIHEPLPKVVEQTFLVTNVVTLLTTNQCVVTSINVTNGSGENTTVRFLESGQVVESAFTLGAGGTWSKRPFHTYSHLELDVTTNSILDGTITVTVK